jgi:hypothetical protein
MFHRAQRKAERVELLRARDTEPSEGSAEEQEYSSIVSAIVAYEQRRWPDGKTAGAKG